MNQRQKTKYYVGGLYEVEIDGSGNERKLHYITAGDGLAAIFEKTATTENLYYIHKDHLGSYESVTNENGLKVDSMSYDPWGKRRNPTDWTFNNVPPNQLFDRGFTGHEHLGEFNLINMNGRVYDQVLCRFLSPDIFIQDPGNVQNYNRYSYALNNPLKYIDPSGYKIRQENRTVWISMFWRRYLENGYGEGGSRGGGGSSRYMGTMYGTDGEIVYGGISGHEVYLENYNRTRSGRIDNDNIAPILDAIRSGLDITIVSFDSNLHVVTSIGVVNTQTALNGGLFSYNPTASYFSTFSGSFVAQSQGRPDLGYVGNEIRDRAGSDFSKNMFENYWLGKGDVHLSQSRFNDIVSHAGTGGKGRNVTLSNGQPGVARVHSFYGNSNPYAPVLGSATIYYQGGTPVGFQDGYDFNWRWMWGEGSRTIANELKTRAVSTAGAVYGAEPFNIYYGIRP